MPLMLCLAVGMMRAQHINRNYTRQSMSVVLKDLDHLSVRYRISFIYNELEDFTVTKHIDASTVQQAIRQVIGFYPIAVNISDSLITVECTQKEPGKVIGRVVDEQGRPMEFVNVALLHATDSTFINGGVSNEAGDFVIPCGQDEVIIKVSYVGYTTYCRRIRQHRVGNIRLVPDAYNLRGVTVKGSVKTDYVDHSAYTFSAEQVKNARQSQELLATLPGLYIDAQTQKVTNLMGKTMKILLNGVEATDNDLKMVPPGKVRRVDYYTDPPARWADVGLVVNVITAPLDNGYAAGVDISDAVTTLMGDHTAYFRYTKGYHQLSFDYDNSFRNYRNRHSERRYIFTQADGHLADYTYQGKDHFGYTVNNFTLKYSYSKPDDVTFQVSAKPNFMYYFSRGKEYITANNNPLWADAQGKGNDRTNTFGPSVDVYFEKKLPKNQKIFADLVATYYHNTQRNTDLQQTVGGDSILVDDQLSSKNNKYSVIGEVDYEKSWGQTQLSLGYEARLTRSDYVISNMLSDYAPYDYSSSSANHNLYGELGSKLRQWDYRVGVTLNYVETHNDDTRFRKFYASPKLLLARNFGHSQLQFHFGFGLNVPSVATLSKSSSVIIPGLIRQGNPWLKTGGEYDAVMTYNHRLDWIDASVQLFAIYTDKPQNTYYQWKTLNGQPVIVSSYENATCLWQSGGSVTTQIKPFKTDVFTIRLSAAAMRYDLRSQIIGNRSFWYTPVRYNLNFCKGPWGASYQGRIVSKRLDGTYLTSDENNSHVRAFYQKGAWRFTATCLWLFTKAKYSSKTIDNDVMNYKSRTWIDDNRSTILLGVSWNFLSGKSKAVERSINNRDNDSGTL